MMANVYLEKVTPKLAISHVSVRALRGSIVSEMFAPVQTLQSNQF